MATTTLFLACVTLGVTVLGAQILLNLIGIGFDGGELDAPGGGVALEAGADVGDVGDVGHVSGDFGVAELDADGFDLEAIGDDDGGTSQGLNLLSVRAVSGGVAVFGAAGLIFEAFLPGWLAVPLAVPPALAAAYGIAWVTAKMVQAQSDASLRLPGAVGREARVYLTVPASSATTSDYGLVHVTLQGRSVELRAVTSEPDALETGSSVIVLAVQDDGETLEVVRESTFKDMLR